MLIKLFVFSIVRCSDIYVCTVLCQKYLFFNKKKIELRIRAYKFVLFLLYDSESESAKWAKFPITILHSNIVIYVHV